MPKKKANIKEILAANLKKFRKNKGFTQEKLAEKADMSLHYLAIIELATNFPSGEMLEKLAKALDIETHELFKTEPSATDELKTLRQEIINEIKSINETLKECQNSSCPYIKAK